MFDSQIIIKLLLAVLLGGIIGFEREKDASPAGLRTHILVCLGSALITLTSTIFTDDPARIAAGIVTGIGFLGAGAILHSKKFVHGLTTAASIWAVAGIGIAVGVGFYLGAIASSIIIYFVLRAKPLESKLFK